MATDPTKRQASKSPVIRWLLDSVKAVKSSDQEIATLITMRLSHYCEKARWGLDRLDFPYREEVHVPLVHRIFTTQNKGSTVPMLVHAGQSLGDSAEILAYIDTACGGGCLYPRDRALKQEVQELENSFDGELGPHVRRWAYSHLLDERKLLVQVWSDGAPRSEALVVPAVLPIARWLIRRSYKITTDSAARSLDRVNNVFKMVEARLCDGRTYLVGDCLTAADLTFASLAAPVLFPSECRAALPALETVPSRMQDQVARFRETVAGKFAIGLYQRERDVTTLKPMK
jgi:glutathione S-transferase